jgi:phospholipid/cholesterol/gamma-HCH transport system substrate-binding protein
MERKASYTIVGLLTLVLIGIASGFTYWFVQSGFNNSYTTYNVEFNFPVDGLIKGSEVHFNGIKVGEVTLLKIGKINTSQIIATVKIDAEVPVKTDSMATLEPQGVTGLAYINIQPGSENAKIIKIDPLAPTPVIRATESRLSKLLSGSGSVIEDAYETLSRVNRLLSDKNIGIFSQSLVNIEAVTADLKAREAMIDDAHAAIVSARQAADAVTLLAQSGNEVLSKNTPETLAKLNAATEKLGAAAVEVEILSKQLQGPASQINDSTLPQMEESLKNLDEASRALKDLANEARASPQDFAAKGAHKERKVSQ